MKCLYIRLNATLVIKFVLHHRCKSYLKTACLLQIKEQTLDMAYTVSFLKPLKVRWTVQESFMCRHAEGRLIRQNPLAVYSVKFSPSRYTTLFFQPLKTVMFRVWGQTTIAYRQTTIAYRQTTLYTEITAGYNCG